MHQELWKDIQAVIFDMDGSLVDSMWMWKEIDREYLGRFGIGLPETLQAEINGRSFVETAFFFKERFGLTDSPDQIMEDWNRMARDKYEHEVPLKEGADEFLLACIRNKIPLGIATSNSRELVDVVLGRHGIGELFSCVLTSKEVPRGKPAPDIYLEAAGRLGIHPGRCLVFEDIVPGILAGKRAGMRVCAVQDDYSADEWEEKKRLADWHIRDYHELKGFPLFQGREVCFDRMRESVGAWT